MFRSEIATLTIFSFNTVEFLTFNQIFSMIFGLPTRGSVVCTPLVMEPTFCLPPKQIPGYTPDHIPTTEQSTPQFIALFEKKSTFWILNKTEKRKKVEIIKVL